MFFPDSIDLSESEKYILAIRLQAGSFSFVIHDPEKNDAYVFRETAFKNDISYLQQVQRTIFDLNFLTQTFLRTYVEIVSARQTLVPVEFFDPRQKNIYLEKAFIGDTGHTLSETIGKAGVELVYDLESELFEFLSRNLFAPIFTHHTASLMRLFNVDSGKAELFSRMHLYFSGEQMDIMVIRGGKIQLLQSFTKDSEPDLFYFVMNIWKSMEMDQLNDRLFISGENEKHASLLPLFSKYIRHVEQRGMPSEAFLLGEEAQKTPIDLLALLL